MKKIITIVLMLLALSSVSYARNGSDEGLGGTVGFRRSFLRIQGELIKNLGAAQPGLNYLVGANTVKDSLGVEITPASWGWNFSTDFLQDEQVVVTGITAETWFNWSNVRWMGGVRADFTTPADEESFLEKDTNGVGGTLRARFESKGLPFEIGGAFTRSYSGVKRLDISSIYLGLVFTE